MLGLQLVCSEAKHRYRAVPVTLEGTAPLPSGNRPAPTGPQPRQAAWPADTCSHAQAPVT